MTASAIFDLAIVGGGINGCGIAADAAGRGLKVLLAEQGDLAGATSSASSKLIHGGLRYLEHYEFRLVREALGEREVLLKKAPHIIWPLRFVLPHVPGLRPAWMVRAGLLLYDTLHSRHTIPGSRGIDLAVDPAGRPLQAGMTRGFSYWDCWVDDARLVVLNARAAATKGAEICVATKVTAVLPDGALWRVVLQSGNEQREIRARALVNAAGPWVSAVEGLVDHGPRTPKESHVRMIKGSHIVVPRISGADDAYLLQNADKRVVFALPYEETFTIIGTTDVPYDGDPAKVAISGDEEDYLLTLAGHFFKTPLTRTDIVWRYSGVRPLYDDGRDNPSAVTRDYHLETGAADAPPRLSVYGGKVTTYRRLAEEALGRLAPRLPGMGAPWTESATLPGGDIPGGDFDGFVAEVARCLPAFDRAHLRRIARRHGSLTVDVLGDARDLTGMGQHFGHGLSEREVRYMKAHEWARSADDVLWRRSKVGLHLGTAERRAAEAAIGQIL